MLEIIPKKDRDVEGPSSLSVAVGTPNSANKDTSVSTLCWHTVEVGSPIVR